MLLLLVRAAIVAAVGLGGGRRRGSELRDRRDMLRDGVMQRGRLAEGCSLHCRKGRRLVPMVGKKFVVGELVTGCAGDQDGWVGDSLCALTSSARVGDAARSPVFGHVVLATWSLGMLSFPGPLETGVLAAKRQGTWRQPSNQL